MKRSKSSFMKRCITLIYLAFIGGCSSTSSSNLALSQSTNQVDKISINPNIHDSGLRDCDIPFEELRSRSPSCRNFNSNNGRICEQYSPSEFPEVVLITSKISGNSFKCSGTLIGDEWVLTAAHCILGNRATSKVVNTKRADFNFRPGPGDSIDVTAANAFFLSVTERSLRVTEAFVYWDYQGINSFPPFLNDVALLHLSRSFPFKRYGQGLPARLAPLENFSPKSTIAGYGYSNSDGGTLGKFNLTWPVDLVKTETNQIILPGQSRRNFCQGDSGGPVFLGRYRGCSSTDIGGEPRPRLVQALISWNSIPWPSSDDNTERAKACMSADKGGIQSVTNKRIRDWICKITKSQAGGCR